MTVPYTVIIPPDDPLPPPPDRTLIATDKIAEDLKTAILANSTLAAAYTVVRYGSTLYIQKNGGDFTPYIADSLENTGMTLVKGSVQGADELPAEAPDGLRMKVSGDPTTTVDDYWTTFSGGHWNESAAPGTLQTLTKTLMPWVLSSTGTGSSRQFTFGPVDWTVRDAGDDTSNPLPPITSIDTLFVTEGRLGFLSGPDIVLSASNEPLRIFRRSVAQLLPNDPVAVRSTLGNVGRYHAVLDWDGAAQLWSNQVQRALYGQPAITASTTAVDPTSSFDNDPSCPPIVVGTNIYFTRAVNGSVRVFEYFLPPGYNALPEVRDLTDAVPSYLAGAAHTLVADQALGFLAVIPQGTGSTLYVCNLRPSNNTTIPIWHRWTFSGSLVTARIIANKLLLLINRSSQLSVEWLDISNPANTAAGAVADVGGSAVAPAITFDRVYFQTQNGPDATSRVTVRNLTLFHKDTRAGSLRFTDESTDRVTISAPIPSTPLRVPVLRTIESTGFTIRWTGFLTNIELQGSIVSRSRRL